MVVILPDLSKMVCSAHAVHRTRSPEKFDLRAGPRRFSPLLIESCSPKRTKSY
jgi:hypothetical protein